ncbi:MAG TPA: helix-turn-helix domain-containing protein [Conexibacter sp.]
MVVWHGRGELVEGSDDAVGTTGGTKPSASPSMLTVSQAAFRVGRDPTTIRRWIRSGRLRAERVGTRHVIKEHHLSQAAHSDMLPLPPGWDRMANGEPMPDIVAFIRGSRAGR